MGKEETDLDEEPTKANRAHNAPPDFIRVQLERVINSIGLRGAGRVLGLSLSQMTAFQRKGVIPSVDIERLDEVYVAVRWVELDIELSDVMADCRTIIHGNFRRKLDAIALQQREG